MALLTPTDYTNKDYEAFRTQMLQDLKIRLPEYTDFSQSDMGVVLIELMAKGLDILSYYQDTIQSEVFLTTAEQRENILKWCDLFGYVPEASEPAKFKQVFKLNFISITPVTIPKGTILKTVSDEIYFEVEEDFIIPENKQGDEVDVEGKYLYTTSIVQGISYKSESLGKSTGASNQRFELKNKGVVEASVLVTINEPSGQYTWTKVNSFIDSSENDRHFILRVGSNNECYIIFGDGDTGMIPPQNSEGIYCSYRTSVGAKGNVSPNTITTMVTNLASVCCTFNPYESCSIGKDIESNESIKKSIPYYARTVERAVTLQDYSDLIKLNFPEVTFASTIQDNVDKDKANVYIVVDSTSTYTKTSAKIVDFMEDRQMIGVSMSMNNYTIKAVDIEANVIVNSRYTVENIEQNIRDFLTSYFEIGKIDFGRKLPVSLLTGQIINGVEGILALTLTVPTQAIITASLSEILTLGTVTLHSVLDS